jgi:hypothetical protein
VNDANIVESPFTGTATPQPVEREAREDGTIRVGAGPPPWWRRTGENPDAECPVPYRLVTSAAVLLFDHSWARKSRLLAGVAGWRLACAG